MPEEMRAHPGAGLNGFSQVQQDDEAQSGQCNGRTRPVSFYDNYKDVSAMPPCVTSAASVGNLNQVRENGATTTTTLVTSATSAGNVSKIQGNNRATVVRKSRPPLLRHRKLARTLAAAQTILGIAVTSLALWLLLWSPNLPLSDNPYWSGMPLLLSGSFGICLLFCFKKEYPGMSPGLCLSVTKTISVLLSVLATLTCVLACSAAIIHLVKLSGLECTPARVRNATCACRPKSEIASPAEPVLKYVDLNCPEVEGILTILLILSACCNGLGAVIAGWYLYLHWSTREKRPEYIKVRTGNASALDPRPIYNPNLHNR
ncbi:sarcospan isoform X5 [Diachasmimorpha longicaudata]|uniref:sarcospan isoform X5 n=1 Tax=Diachasmimorpha longicaudata TaxID=58733 RepID=UPI0030B898F2